MVDIEREHPEYIQRQAMLRAYHDLYVGGQQLKDHSTEYLSRRQNEPLDVYSERLERLYYENHIGSIIDWYAATLFRREPVITFDGKSEVGRRFLGEFIQDCDLKGTTVTEFFRSCFIDALVGGAAHILVDFPKSQDSPANRAEEEAAGLARAYLLRYGAEELTNWSKDEHGQYEWVVLRRRQRRQPTVDSATVLEETYWYYFDKQEFRVYRKVSGREQKVELISEGRHGMAKLHRVPLFTLRVSEGLWLMNKSALLQLEHLNKSNALSWAITMGLFAMPVIYSERAWNQVVGESYYIQLGSQDRFGWTEPEGRVYQIAADNLSRLKDEIYRVCYLTQAGGGVSASHPESGLSKLRDFAITQEVLRSYGDAVKETLRKVIDAISITREDDVIPMVSGMDEFDIGDFATELADAQTLLQLGIDSPTLKKQIFQKLAFKYLCDVRQETKDAIAAEIEAQIARSQQDGGHPDLPESTWNPDL